MVVERPFHIEAVDAMKALKILNASINFIASVKQKDMPRFVVVDNSPLAPGFNVTVTPSPWLAELLEEYQRAVA
jgi:hypothetical protein